MMGTPDFDPTKVWDVAFEMVYSCIVKEQNYPRRCIYCYMSDASDTSSKGHRQDCPVNDAIDLLAGSGKKYKL